MRKIDKVKNEEFYTKVVLDWLTHRGYYNHYFESWRLYDYMYFRFHLSWHKTQRIIFKNIPKKILDELRW